MKLRFVCDTRDAPEITEMALETFGQSAKKNGAEVIASDTRVEMIYDFPGIPDHDVDASLNNFMKLADLLKEAFGQSTIAIDESNRPDGEVAVIISVKPIKFNELNAA